MRDRALFESGEGSVEYVVPKKVITDPTTRDALIFKERFLRRLGGFIDLLDERAQRYHDLLVKSLREKLSPDEAKELGVLEIDRALPQQAKEIANITALEAAISELRKRIRPDELSL